MRPLLAATVLLLAACSERTSTEAAAAAHAVTSLPDRVRVQGDLAAVRGALQTYKAEHGSWPASIADLGLTPLAYPADLSYDASTGTVTSLSYPGL